MATTMSSMPLYDAHLQTGILEHAAMPNIMPTMTQSIPMMAGGMSYQAGYF
jgi:hypothetical protein